MEVGMDILSPEEEQILQKTMHRLAERVRGCVEECEGDGVNVRRLGGHRGEGGGIA